MPMRVSNYTDLRTFLGDVYQERKQRHPAFSFGSWARRLGLKSPSTLVMIINGQRRPSLDLAAKMADDLQLATKDRAYFLDLVRLARAKTDPDGAALVAARLASTHAGKPFQTLGQDAFAAISRWHFYAIRELVRLKDFRDDPAWMADRLSSKAHRIGVRDVKQAVATMVRLGLLSRNAAGHLVAHDVQLDTGNDVVDEGLRRYHEGIADLTKAAVRAVVPSEREISGVTFAIKQEKLAIAKSLIRDLQRRLVSLCEADGDADQIYHFETAFIPLTKAIAARDAKANSRTAANGADQELH